MITFEISAQTRDTFDVVWTVSSTDPRDAIKSAQHMGKCDGMLYIASHYKYDGETFTEFWRVEAVHFDDLIKACLEYLASYRTRDVKYFRPIPTQGTSWSQPELPVPPKE
jgi:hypothetical protein